jgi:ABC-type lipoprotein release transport system permease subunit
MSAVDKNGKVNFLILAFRNLSRHKVKTILTVTAIAVGMTLYIWFDAWLLGMNLDSRRNLVNFETGAAKIYSKAYFNKKDELPLYEAFDNYQPIIDKLEQNGFNAAPHAVFAGSLKSETQELPFIFIGIDPEKEIKLFRYNKYLEKNSEFVQNSKFNTIIGVKGAKDLNVNIGDDVTLYTVIDMKDEYGKIKHVYQVINLKVIGLVNSPNPKTNGNIAYLPLDILQDELGILLNGRVTEICIRRINAKDHELPGKKESPEVIKKALGSLLRDDLTVVSWLEDAKDYLAVALQDKVSTYIFISLLFVLSVFGIANTMLMAVYERTKEIGMLRALGMKDIDVIRLFLYEAGLIGLIGSLFGIFLGILLNIYMVKYGIDYTEILEQANMKDVGYRVVGIYKSAWNWNTIMISGIIAPILSALIAFIPARKAVKMNIVNTLRFE